MCRPLLSPQVINVSNYIARRVLWLVPVFLFISVITFVMMHNIEGGPWDSERKLPDNVTENLNRKYGLDKPLWRQYVSFIGDALHGDMGISFKRQDKPVTQILLAGLKVTGMLGLMALLVAAGVGVTLGVLAAVNRNGPLTISASFLQRWVLLCRRSCWRSF